MGKTEKAAKDFRLVIIECLDSYGCSSSRQDLANCEPSVVCKSIGWLIHDGDKCKVIVSHLNQPDHRHKPTGLRRHDYPHNLYRKDIRRGDSEAE
jgi:hypothetical protein